MTQNFAVNFRELKERITIQDVLRHFQVHINEWKNDEGRGSCPLPGCDGKRTFTVNTTKQVFKCHVCKRGGDIIDFVKIKQEFSTLKEAGTFLSDAFGINAGENQNNNNPRSVIEEREPVVVEEPVILPPIVKGQSIGLQLGRIELAANQLLEEVRALRKQLDIDA